MPTSRCPVVRQQKPPFQDQTTDYHDWTDRTGYCRFCGQSRKETQVDLVLRERTWDEALPSFPWSNVMAAYGGLHAPR